MLALDHVIYGVADLDAAAERFEADFGLTATGGGVHPGGTKNLAVRCDDGSYIELLAVHDPEGPLAQWVQSAIADGDTWIGWAVRTDDMPALVARLGITTQRGSIVAEDGTEGSWVVGGTEALGAGSNRPFFIDYGALERLPAPPNSPRCLAWVEVGGDEAEVREWLSDDSVPVRVVTGERRLLRVAITMADGTELTIAG